jgi:2-hydroxy-3-oxopropionate reductase
VPIQPVGFIGLGIMSIPMARNIIKAGYPMVACNRSHSRAKELARDGAHAVFTPKKMADNCSMVITMVPDTPDFESVILGQL